MQPLEGSGPAGQAPDSRSSTASDNADFLLRTWERGVEGETLACGSGAVATALACRELYGANLPLRLRVRSGEVLTVAEENQRGMQGGRRHLIQSGAARIVAHGNLWL